MQELCVFGNLIDSQDFSHSNSDVIGVGSHVWPCLLTSCDGLNNGINIMPPSWCDYKMISNQSIYCHWKVCRVRLFWVCLMGRLVQQDNWSYEAICVLQDDWSYGAICVLQTIGPARRFEQVQVCKRIFECLGREIKVTGRYLNALKMKSKCFGEIRMR